MKALSVQWVRALSAIYFVKRPCLGWLISLMVVCHPGKSLICLLVLLSALLYDRMAPGPRPLLDDTVVLLNLFLVAMAVADRSMNTISAVGLGIISGPLTVLWTQILKTVFNRFELPVLSMPYVMAGWCLNGGVAIAHDPSVPGSTIPLLSEFTETLWVPFSGYFKALGALIYLPDPAAGMVIAVVLFLSAPGLALLSVVGYLAGGSFSVIFSGLSGVNWLSPLHFNNMLVAMAIGGIFLVPGIRSMGMALAAVGINALFMSWMMVVPQGQWLVPSVWPFNLTTLLVLSYCRLTRYPELVKSGSGISSRFMQNQFAKRNGLKPGQRAISLPFRGSWTVWQGFDGEWTHQGSNAYALDFVITNEDHKSFQGQGTVLNDFYCYEQPVLSPISGWVKSVFTPLPDNEPGLTDRENPWGNYIILQTADGMVVELSHLRQFSEKVVPGQWVNRGDFLALVGNSGYSPQPHIHVQVQESVKLGSQTLAFFIRELVVNKEYLLNQVPERDMVITSPSSGAGNRFIENIILDQVLEYEVFNGSSSKETLRLTARMNEAHQTFLESDAGCIYWAETGNCMVAWQKSGHHPCIDLLYKALYRVPHRFEEGWFWEDDIDLFQGKKTFEKFWNRVLVFLGAKEKNAQLRYVCISPFQVEIYQTFPTPDTPEPIVLHWDHSGRLIHIQCGDLEMLRLNPSEPAVNRLKTGSEYSKGGAAGVALL